MSIRVGIDVGGTFTDFLLGNADGDRTVSWKTPSTRPDSSVGIFAGLDELVRRGELRAEDIREITVGNTVALNAILEGRGACTGMLVTRGFRDILEIGRERRRLLYDLQQEKLPVLVPRRLRLEVDERINFKGEVLRPLDLEQARRTVASLVAQGVESVAVCLLHVYANPSHERQLKQLILDEFPGLSVSVSHEVLNHYREYERALLTVLNAYVQPIMHRYLEGLEHGVRWVSPGARTYVTHSAGGVMGVRAARERAIHSALSGPAAGVRGAAYLAGLIGRPNFITMDMGGTSCDVAVVQQDAPQMTMKAELGGYPVGVRTVDIHSISAGGGTVAWVDGGGLLRVGPQSTGSLPGPACYQRGGEQATITDAHLLLGHLDPGNVLGGAIQLSVEAAERAIRRHVAEPLGLDVVEAAAGILTVANAAMVRAIEVMSIERGHDPREFTLMAFGGAAPLHAAAIAEELDIDEVVVPREAGVLCALGALCCDERYEVSRSVLLPTLQVDPAELAAALRELEAEARSLVEPERSKQARLSSTLDVRYAGQTATLEVPLDDWCRPEAIQRVHQAFETRYHDVFGYTVEQTPSEIESVRVALWIPRPPLTLPHAPTSQASRSPLDAPRPWRAHFGRHGFAPCLLYQAEGLVADASIAGPAVVNAPGSTAVIHPGQSARVDQYGDLIIKVA